MSARRKALTPCVTSTLNFRVQGLNRQRHYRGASFRMSIPSEQPTRHSLRRQLREARRALSRLEQRQASLGLYRQLAQHPSFRRARHIALYLPNDGEIDPQPLLRAAQRRGKHTYLPVLASWPRTHMRMQRLLPGERLQRNRFGIAEPRPNRARQRPLWALDLLLCRWWVSMNRVAAWAWAAASTTAAWPIASAVRTCSGRVCSAWLMSARRLPACRWPAGTYRCTA